MNIKRNLVFLFLSVVGFFSVKPALAIEPMTLKELSELCDNYQQDEQSSESLQCVRYLKGFVDGAIAIDSSIAKDPREDLNPSYTERAFKSRVGNRLQKYATPSNHDFCIGKPVLMKDVVIKVKKNILLQPKSDELALFVVYRTLRQEFPCQ